MNFQQEIKEKGTSLYEFPNDYTIIDIETTGLSPENCEIIELSALKIRDNNIVDSFSSLVCPNNEIPSFIESFTGITNDMVKTAPKITDVLEKFLSFIKEDILMGHNVNFDIRFINHNCDTLYGYTIFNDYIDTCRISKKLVFGVPNYKLGSLAKFFGIDYENAHRALEDCKITFELFNNLKELDVSKNESLLNHFEECTQILKDKKVVFKGTLNLYSFDTYARICERAGGKAMQIFYSNVDYIVFSNSSYKNYENGKYSEAMLKAIELSKQGSLQILSEFEFLNMFNLDIKIPVPGYEKNVDIKSMSPDEGAVFDESHPLFGKVCVFTGTLDKIPRKDAMQAVLNLGGQIGNSVTKKTNFLILGCNDFCSSIKDGKSNKHKKAEELKLEGYDIEIIDEKVFYSLLEE